MNSDLTIYQLWFRLARVFSLICTRVDADPCVRAEGRHLRGAT